MFSTCEHEVGLKRVVEVGVPATVFIEDGDAPSGIGARPEILVGSEFEFWHSTLSWSSPPDLGLVLCVLRNACDAVHVPRSSYYVKERQHWS
jgi:hypothetical protein